MLRTQNILHSRASFKNVFGRRIRQKLALRNRILFASTKVMHMPRSDFPPHFDINNTYQIHTEK